MELHPEFWSERYRNGETGWDLGAVSPPLKAYFDTLTNRDWRILIPGCGRAYEAEYLWRKGFAGVHVLDWSSEALEAFANRVEDFPKAQLLQGDFFKEKGTYNLIVEQTFFCAIDPGLRNDYARKVADLLVDGGKLMGLLFDDPLNNDRPPYGGDAGEYRRVLEPHLHIHTLERAFNSVEPRAGRELFILAEKRQFNA